MSNPQDYQRHDDSAERENSQLRAELEKYKAASLSHKIASGMGLDALVERTEALKHAEADLAIARAQVETMREALTNIQDKAIRATVVQDRSVNIIKQTCKYISDIARDALNAAKAKQ